MTTRIKLTKERIAKLDLEKEGQWVTDTEVPQLVVRLTPTAKTYVARWTSKRIPGKRNQATIARFGEISVDEARDRARKLVAEDNNPTVETLGDVYRIWDEHYSSRISEAHADEFRRSWQKHIEPDMAKMKLSRLTGEYMQGWYAKKRKEHPTTPTGKVAESPYSAATVNRWISYISKLCTIARKGGYMIGNPVERLEVDTPNVRVSMFNREDVKLLGENLDASADKYPKGVAILRFLMLFPCRGIEARRMQWSQVDLEAQRWTLPGHFYKTKKPKSFPLGPLVVEFLKELPRWSETYVFPAPSNPEKPMRKEYQRDIWQKVRPKALGAHDMRRTFGTLLLNKRVPLEIVSKLLGHSSTIVTQKTYAFMAAETARQHLSIWSAMLEDDEPEEPENDLAEIVDSHYQMTLAQSQHENT